jgi:hypothetical protein
VRVDRLLVECVDDGHLGRAARSRDRLRQRVERRARAPGQVDPGALTREGRCDAPADRSAGAVDDHVLVLEQHAMPFA